MKRVLSIAVLIAILSVSATAQRANNRDQFNQNNNGNRNNNNNNKNNNNLKSSNAERTETNTNYDDRLDKLELTAAQKISIDSIKNEFGSKRDDVKQNKSLTKLQLKSRMQELQKEETEKVNAFLTKQQKKQLRKEKSDQ